jgi:hypothetical protein
VLAWTGLVAATMAAEGRAAEPAPGDGPEPTCEEGRCVFVDGDDDLLDEQRSLVETLGLRLCRHGVRVEWVGNTAPKKAVEKKNLRGDRDEAEDGCAEAEPSPEDVPTVWWIIHLKRLSDDQMLVAVDHLGSQSDEDLIREVPRGPDASATAWTVALLIENALMPYLEAREDLKPLGAGLAIIEPQVVGGVKKSDEAEKTLYPQLRSLGLGLAIHYLGAASNGKGDFLFGPRIGVEGFLGPRFVGSISAGWVGTGSFDDRTAAAKGTVSQVPLELLFGFLAVRHPQVGLVINGGVSVGFSIYRTSSSIIDSRRSDTFFDPVVEVQLELTVVIYGPIAGFVYGGLGFPIVRDILENNGDPVYRQDWIVPLVGIGLKLLFGDPPRVGSD